MSPNSSSNAVAGNSAQSTTGLVNPIACPNCGMSDIATGAPEVLPRDYHTHSCRNCLLMFTPRASIGDRYKALCAMVTPSLVEAGRGLPLGVSQHGRQAIIWGIMEREYGQAVHAFARGLTVPSGWDKIEGGAEVASAADIVRALAGMTPYGEDGDGEDAMEVLNQLIGFARKALNQ